MERLVSGVLEGPMSEPPSQVSSGLLCLQGSLHWCPGVPEQKWHARAHEERTAQSPALLDSPRVAGSSVQHLCSSKGPTS